MNLFNIVSIMVFIYIFISQISEITIIITFVFGIMKSTLQLETDI